MADDRQQLLSEAYRRGILPPDMKSAYEEAQKRNIVQGSEPSFGEEFLHGMADPVLGVAQMVSRGTGLGATAAPTAPTAPAEGVKTEQKVRPAEPEGMTAGRFLGNLVTGAGVGGAAASF